jgi:hypothetical protein
MPAVNPSDPSGTQDVMIFGAHVSHKLQVSLSRRRILFALFCGSLRLSYRGGSAGKIHGPPRTAVDSNARRDASLGHAVHARKRQGG